MIPHPFVNVRSGARVKPSYLSAHQRYLWRSSRYGSHVKAWFPGHFDGSQGTLSQPDLMEVGSGIVLPRTGTSTTNPFVPTNLGFTLTHNQTGGTTGARYSTPTVPVLTLPCSIECWLNVDVSATMYVLSLDDGTNGVALRIATGGFVEAYAVDAGGNSVASNLFLSNINVMGHCVAVFESETSRSVYLDGVFSASNTTSRTAPAPATNMRMGRNPLADSGLFNGEWADLALYDIALTGAEVFELYNNGLKRWRGSDSELYEFPHMLFMGGAPVGQKFMQQVFSG